MGYFGNLDAELKAKIQYTCPCCGCETEVFESEDGGKFCYCPHENKKIKVKTCNNSFCGNLLFEDAKLNSCYSDDPGGWDLLDEND